MVTQLLLYLQGKSPMNGRDENHKKMGISKKKIPKDISFFMLLLLQPVWHCVCHPVWKRW